MLATPNFCDFIWWPRGTDGGQTLKEFSAGTPPLDFCHCLPGTTEIGHRRKNATTPTVKTASFNRADRRRVEASRPPPAVCTNDYRVVIGRSGRISAVKYGPDRTSWGCRVMKSNKTQQPLALRLEMDCTRRCLNYESAVRQQFEDRQFWNPHISELESCS